MGSDLNSESVDVARTRSLRPLGFAHLCRSLPSGSIREHAAGNRGLLISASDDKNANKRVGRRIDAPERTRTGARSSRRPGK